ncbi:MAG: N-acetyltransferase [Gammaproteobacteria bacterium]|nr:N-acetyltransferase [Gammaproteobacteria bacterium]
MRIQRLSALAEIPPDQWNALVRDDNPFLRHEFLDALERHHCVGERTGWLPWHLVCYDDQQHLLAAAPLYVKDNSYGEFVFDWGWADAYRRHGLSYYPKLVGAVPFTPATGQRLLLAPDAPVAAARAIVAHALEDVERHGFSSLHWLFNNDEDMALLDECGFLRRCGCQFHWRNAGYRDFTDFLDTLTSKKRKNIKRERRLVQEAGLTLQILHGPEISEAQWRAFHHFYRSTFHRLGGMPTLTLSFFQEISQTLGNRLVLVSAKAGSQDVAVAISLRSATTLYGRHWGCQETYDSLHFELCYYQGLEYCIEHGLTRFEPGAQGEHKIYRGFLPTLTQSAHWLAHPGFREAVADFLKRETPAVESYARELTQHSPYRAPLHPTSC